MRVVFWLRDDTLRREYDMWNYPRSRSVYRSTRRLSSSQILDSEILSNMCGTPGILWYPNKKPLGVMTLLVIKEVL